MTFSQAIFLGGAKKLKSISALLNGYAILFNRVATSFAVPHNVEMYILEYADSLLPCDCGSAPPALIRNAASIRGRKRRWQLKRAPDRDCCQIWRLSLHRLSVAWWERRSLTSDAVSKHVQGDPLHSSCGACGSVLQVGLHMCRASCGGYPVVQWYPTIFRFIGLM